MDVEMTGGIHAWRSSEKVYVRINPRGRLWPDSMVQWQFDTVEKASFAMKDLRSRAKAYSGSTVKDCKIGVKRRFLEINQPTEEA